MEFRSFLTQSKGVIFELNEHYETDINDVLDYEVGGKRAFPAYCMISSEPLNRTMDYVYVDDFNNGRRYFQGPQKKKHFGKIPSYDNEESEPLLEEKKLVDAPLKRKKGTGGKISYVKVYGSRIKEIRGKIGFELIGICMCLAPNIEWETGFLIVGRGKRKKYMTKEDIASELGVSLSTAKRIIKKLTELGVLELRNNKFRLNPKFIAKGMTFDASKVREGDNTGTNGRNASQFHKG